MAEKRKLDLTEECLVDSVIKVSKTDNIDQSSNETSQFEENSAIAVPGNEDKNSSNNTVNAEMDKLSCQHKANPSQQIIGPSEGITDDVSGSTQKASFAKAESAHLDPLSYTKAEEFTSEIFKIQVHNLPKFGFNDLKKRLKSNLQLNPHKIKSDKHYVAYICFRNETDRDEALQKINGHVWKGKTLHAKIAAPVADPFLQKRQTEKEGRELENTTAAGDQAVTTGTRVELTPEEAEARLKANVSPLWNTEYSQQLQMKTEKIKNILERVTRNHFVKHLFTDRSNPTKLACELLPILPSPITSEYRNKNEFTVGYSLDGQTIMVGFRYGMYKDGITAVGDCTNIGIAMPAAIPVVKSFTEFVSKSAWLPFRQETGTGHWQTLTVRTLQTGDVMAMADFVPRKLEQTEIAAAKASLKEFYTTGEGKGVKIKSFYFRVMGGKGQNVKPGSELLFGEPYVYESLLGLNFRISPEAFFQVNTPATENLYQLIAEWCHASSSTTVLDICCGTGTIGLSMARKVKHVVGVEMCRPAVEDAKANASINGITNVTFHCAKVEDVITKIIASVQSSESTDDVVAVVDPPRPGLHKDVIKTLRRCTQLKHLVYVSCNPESAMDNFVDLIRPETGRHKGSPFQMIKAKPVDLFPGTRHCELVLLFTRPTPVTNSDTVSGASNTNRDTTIADSRINSDTVANDGKSDSINDKDTIEDRQETTTNDKNERA